MINNGTSFGIMLLALAGFALPTRAHAQNYEPPSAPAAKKAATQTGGGAKLKANDPGKTTHKTPSKAKGSKQGPPLRKKARTKKRGVRKPTPSGSGKFVDRDGDGIHDGKEHRFRRGRGRRGLRFRDDARRRLQEGRAAEQRQRERQDEGSQKERQGGEGGGR
jgi:hypothetical protein